MNAQLGRLARSAVALGFILTGGSGLAAAEPAPADAKVHAMILVDSLDEKIGESVARDAILVKEALESGFEGREKRLSLTVLEGKDATPEAV